MISVVKVGKSREMRTILRMEISRKDLFALYTRLKYHTLVSCIRQKEVLVTYNVGIVRSFELMKNSK